MLGAVLVIKYRSSLQLLCADVFVKFCWHMPISIENLFYNKLHMLFTMHGCAKHSVGCDNYVLLMGKSGGMPLSLCNI